MKSADPVRDSAPIQDGGKVDPLSRREARLRVCSETSEGAAAVFGQVVALPRVLGLLAQCVWVTLTRPVSCAARISLARRLHGSEDPVRTFVRTVLIGESGKAPRCLDICGLLMEDPVRATGATRIVRRRGHRCSAGADTSRRS